jgi:hypothetical protein
MSDKRNLNTGGVATVRKPRLVLVGGVAGTRITDNLRQLDWDICPVPVGNDLACAILARRPSVVVLPADTGWESGFLLAAKLRKAKPKLKVVVVTPTRKSADERFSRFVGATLVAETEAASKLVHAITG